jgi:hypothetical protein
MYKLQASLRDASVTLAQVPALKGRPKGIAPLRGALKF